MGRGDPFQELHREVNRLFDDTFRGIDVGRGGQGAMMAPRIDIHEAGDDLEITAELPGVVPGDVDLRIEGDLLTIRGEKRRERKDEQAHVVERSYGSFSRSIQLPFQPDADQVRADFENGVLRIRMPRLGQQERSRRIEIGGGSGQGGGQTIEGAAQRRDDERPGGQPGGGS
jgi:HSP20 family protein